ncbi:MAG: hypothetical protein J5969_00060, partial [Lachnospiraceae bacterium]|nr:hypothetical protein [Lachnospiraceae bacterium]
RWQIPVVWMDRLTGMPVSGIAGNGSYYPVLAFYLPDGFAVSGAKHNGSDFMAALDAQTASLFGNTAPISIYDAQSTFTFIFPLWAVPDAAYGKTTSPWVPGLPPELQAPHDGTYNNPDYDGGSDDGGSDDGGQDEEPGQDLAKRVDIHCAKTVKDVLSQEQLEHLVDLIINRIQPQACNLLRECFDAYDKAAKDGVLGQEISLYIYYKNGDNDGKPEHKGFPGAMAYVAGDQFEYMDDTIKYAYMIGVDAAEFCKVNEDGTVVLDESEKKMTDLDNTIVHEMMHAFMDDYNRIGMNGAATPEESTINWKAETYNKTVFPTWFIEGIASSVENVYQFRYEQFQMFRYDPADGMKDEKSITTDTPFTQESLLKTYTTSDFGSETWYYDLEDGEKKDLAKNNMNTPARYISGYLAMLYLGKMAAEKDNYDVTETDESGNIRYKSGNIRYGIDSILQQLHSGVTLDTVISTISDGTYANTDDFTKHFIKGDGTTPDAGSITFCTDFLNYLLDVQKSGTSKHLPNGSILFEFDADVTTPLDQSKEESSELYKVVEDNAYHISTVDNNTALVDGGKSRGAADVTGSGEQQAAKTVAFPGAEAGTEEELAAAAKQGTEGAEAAETTETDAAGKESEPAIPAVEPGQDVVPEEGVEPAPEAGTEVIPAAEDTVVEVIPTVEETVIPATEDTAVEAAPATAETGTEAAPEIKETPAEDAALPESGIQEESEDEEV